MSGRELNWRQYICREDPLLRSDDDDADDMMTRGSVVPDERHVNYVSLRYRQIF